MTSTLRSGLIDLTAAPYGLVANSESAASDNAAALQAAADAAASSLGCLVLPAASAEAPYWIADEVDIPVGVSLISSGGLANIKASVSMSYMLGINSSSATGNRYGVVEGIQLLGNDLAEKCWDIGLAVQRSWRRCRATGALDVGVAIRGAQNCYFERFDVENNGAADADNGGGIRFNHGCGNLLFANCEIRDNRFHDLVFAESASLDDDVADPSGTFATARHIRFVGCIIEGERTESTHQIRLRAGRDIGFIACNLTVFGARNLFYAKQEDAAIALPYMEHCFMNGDAADSIAFHLEDVFSFELASCFLENFSKGFELDDDSSLTLSGRNQFSSITTPFTLLGSGPLDSLVSFNGHIGGFVYRNSGTGTIANGATSATVTHGLALTPGLKDIRITLGENPTNTPGAIWVDNIGATTFVVNCENDPGASGLDFAWRAEVQ